MNWEDIIKTEDFGYWKDEETGENVFNYDYGGKKQQQGALEDIVELLRKAHKMAMQYRVYELNDAIPQYIEDAIDAVSMQIKPEYSHEYEDKLREKGRR